MNLDELVAELDAEFRLDRAPSDEWSVLFERCYDEPYWREYAEPGYEGRWNGLVVRGAPEVEQARTCVFPSDEIVDALPQRTLLFSEHPLDFGDRPGFRPLARASFEALRAKGCSFYHVHLPLDLHPTLAPSRLLADGLGLEDVTVEGKLAVGDSPLSLQGLVARLHDFLGPEIPVHVLLRASEHAGRVAVAAGRGGRPDMLAAALELGATTYVTGNAGTYCDVEEVQELNRRFREVAERAQVSVVDATHYGTERPPQLRMVEWFRRRGLPAAFEENGPK